jgi:hypothetical protein
MTESILDVPCRLTSETADDNYTQIERQSTLPSNDIFVKGMPSLDDDVEYTGSDSEVNDKTVSFKNDVIIYEYDNDKPLYSKKGFYKFKSAVIKYKKTFNKFFKKYFFNG